jgi:hypothetical protein
MSFSIDSPGVAGRYLLAHERLVILVRLHPAVLVGPVFTTLIGLSVAGFVSSSVKVSPDLVLSIWIAWAFLVFYLVGQVARWYNSLFLMTSERIIAISGMLSRDVSSIPLARAEGMRLRRTTMGAILGYGHLVFEAGPRDQVIRTVRFIPYPEQIYLEINDRIYSDSSLYSDQQPDPS